MSGVGVSGAGAAGAGGTGTGAAARRHVRHLRHLRHQGWRAQLAAGRALGRLSAGQRALPDVLIVGAQRAGTTSLWRALRQHPGFLSARLKGVHYFDLAYDRPLSWYRAHFPRRRTLAARGAVTGEASPYYMWHPLAPERIAADLPGVLLVVMLRDPVARAYSAHAHEYARGYETLPFAQAVACEEERLAGQRARMRADAGYASAAVQHHAYLARGRYVEQLERLESLVGRHRLHVVDSGEFFARPAPVLAGLCAALGLSPATDAIAFEQHNARPRSPLPPALEQQLRDYFAPYDARLAQWWGRTPSWWEQWP